MNIIIFCDRPGYIRGGVRHPAAQVYAETELKPEQLIEMLADARLQVFVGGRLRPDKFDAIYLAHVRATAGAKVSTDAPPTTTEETAAAGAEGNAPAANTEPAAGKAKPRAKGGK